MSLHDLYPRLLIIVGPTGVGKSKLALKVAEIWGAEIICADSMQVYRYMDIGTAKPSRIEREMVPHHLLDVVDPDEQFNAALYVAQARDIIDVLANQKPIVVVGGTGLYIKALLGGLLNAPGSDEELRAFYKEQLQSFGKDYLYNLLKDKDPLAARSIRSSDAARMIRALEVWDKTGKSIIEQRNAHRFEDCRYVYLKIGINLDRSRLFEKIDQRADDMIKRGFVEEVKQLITQGYQGELKSMQSLGYRHMLYYLNGLYCLDDAVGLMKRDTKRYAKRQMTWFSADREVQWFSDDEGPDILERIKSFLS